MADFAAVLRKTIAALGDNTPDARERIYQKARSTIEAKLNAVTPPPSAQVIERQMRILEDAISSVKADYASAPAVSEPENDFDKVLKDLEALSKSSSGTSTKAAPVAAQPAVEQEPAAPAISVPVEEEVVPEPQDEAPADEPVIDDEPEEVTSADDEVEVQSTDEERDAPLEEPDTTLEDDEKDEGDENAPDPEEPDPEEPETEQLDLEEPALEEIEPAEPEAPVIIAPVMPTATPAAEKPKPETPEQDAAEFEAASEISDPVKDETFDDRPALRELRNRRAAGKKSRKLPIIAAAVLIAIGVGAVGAWIYRDDAAQLAGISDSTTPSEEAGTEEAPDVATTTDQSSSGDSTTAEPVRKLTQRLLPDGSEVDEGPASGQSTVGEGTSIATSSEGPARVEGEPAEQNTEAAVATGQKAIFYEERTVQEQASASNGTVVWTVEEESPGADLPPEPVIHAEATIPDKRLRLKLSLRRNVDQSLPASYIAELIFITPDDFSGGSVGSVASVSLKQTEQDAGNRLLGVPAKIADGFFLVALSDNKSDIEANNMLLERMDWIDIPIVYTSGRRALITLEKGSAGAQAFNQALAAWKAATSG